MTISNTDQKLIRGIACELSATANIIEKNPDDHGLLTDLAAILYDKSEALVKVLQRTQPPGKNWLEDQFNRITLQRATTHRSER